MAQKTPKSNLSILNNPPADIRGPSLLHELVQKSSTYPAIDFLENGTERRKFSYNDLHSLSNKLAGTIADISPKRKDASNIIPILLPQCPELYIVLLAVLKAGKAFCPISTETPPERLRFMLRDISAEFLVTISTYNEHIRSNTDVRVVLADFEFPRHTNDNDCQLPCVQTTDVAYVLYTSGSTGSPKAVSVSHRAATRSLLAHNRHIPHFDRFLQFAAPTFDVSIFEIFFPWYRGRTLAGCTRSHMLDDLPRIIGQLEVDAAELTPTVASNLLHGRASVPSLKLLLTIGEMLTRGVVDEYGGDETKESILWAMYGPTEAAIHCTLQPNFSASSSVGTIGIPLDTVSVFIAAPAVEDDLHSNIEVLSKGATGELIIGGAQLAEEYLNRSDLTTAAFIDDFQYGRLYRTGDLARIRIDGTLEYLGRVSAGQVKLRGQRVELGEIEDTIMKSGGCRAATVIVVEDTLVAFCGTGLCSVAHADILQTCRRWLPAFMVPSAILSISSMPQLPSGKIDKKALESRYLQTRDSNGTSTLEPNNHLAYTITRVLRQCMKRDVVLDSHLASIGLDSLQAIRIASTLRQEGYNLGAIEILMARTPADLIEICRDSESLDQSHKAPNSPDIMSIDLDDPDLKHRHADITYILNCTPIQEAMLAETIAKPSAYCNWIEVELSTARSFENIRDALLSLTQANEILRTGFYSSSDKIATFFQIVWKALAVSQIQEVSQFSTSYTLGSKESLLRPLNIQVQTRLRKPRLLFQIHHALYDGWTFDLLLQDFDKLLRQEKLSQRPQYREIVRYYARKERYEEDRRAKEYWTALIRDYVPNTLSNFNGRVVKNAGLRTFSGRSAINIDTVIARAKDLSINPQVFFQAATAYILSLYADTADVVIGNVTSGRTIPVTRVENILGPCIASLPFRLDFQSLPRVEDILRRTNDLNRDSLQYCTLPLREIVKGAHVRPGMRLFDVLFVWQQSLDSHAETTLPVQIINSADSLEYKITLEFQPSTAGIILRATVDLSIVSEDQFRLLAQEIDEVVHLFLEDVNCKVSEIKRCFTTKSQSIANPEPHLNLIRHGPARAVEKWAVEAPDREAVICGHVIDGALEVEETVTYSCLNSRANQLARLLVDMRGDQDRLIGVIMEKSINLYVSILAILKLGSGYLPLTPDIPVDRIKAILSEARVKICIGDSRTSHFLRPSLSGDILDIDLTSFSHYSTQNLEIPYHGSNLAYAVFTSGSTGTPKGVLVTQDNLMNNLKSLSRLYPFSINSRMLQACSQAFDVSVFEIFFSWYVGICLCTARKDDLFRDLEATINYLGVTHLSLTPTVAALVEPENVPKVEFLVTAGEALTERVRRRWTGRGLYQGYGPSETTNICTVNASVSAQVLINNIGPPLDNTSAFVFSPDCDIILPRGAMGELCFGGAQVFRGYLNMPELNAAKIIQHPLYGRIYRSGDMGTMLADDSLLFVRRLDDQVKVRGQRVELGEITSSLLDHDGIRDCVTLLMSRLISSQALVTFWVPTQHESAFFELLDFRRFRPTILSLFSSLSRRLPSYMVPSHLIPISHLPMTAQAKIDKKLLQKMVEGLAPADLVLAAEPQEAEEDSALWSKWERRVAQILSQQLGLPEDKIRRTSSFFNLGLDSISAISFCNALRAGELADFAVSTVLRNPTIARLTSLRERWPVKRYKTPKTDLSQVFQETQVAQIQSHYQELGLLVAKILPCTPLQEAMLSSRLSPSGAAYCNMMVFNVTGDVPRLRESWKLVAQRHEILRTSFASTEDPQHAFAQVVLENYDIPWHENDSLDNASRRGKEMLGLLLDSNKPPVYLTFDRKDVPRKLLFCCHHALYDGIAIGTLLKEVQNCYTGSSLPSPIKFDLYLQHMIAQDITRSDPFWIASFKNFEPTFFPDLTGRVAKPHSSPDPVRRTLQIPLSEVRQGCKDASISLLSIVQAAWAKLLYFYTSESDICFGNVVSGRSLPGDNLEHLVAPCFNTLPVRVNFDFQDENSKLVDVMHRFNIDSLDHQLTSLRRIQSLTACEGGRLFNTLVILQQPSAPLDSSIWTLEHDSGEMDLPVVCEVLQDQTQDTLTLVLQYQTSLLLEADAAIVSETFDYCVSSLIKYPHAAANDTIFLPSRLEAESNMQFRCSESESTLLHHGLERNARLQPDRIALDFLQSDGTRTVWDYKALNDKANEIALALIDRKVRPEDIVPIHLPKSPEFYASVLGILKAGAAFVPLHPELPVVRKQFMFEQLNCTIVLCSQEFPFLEGSPKVEIVIVDAKIRSCPDNPSVQGLSNSNLAYCLFTSGSTGFPKAVSMEHRSPIQTIESSRSLIPWDSSSRLLQYAATTFDMCYYDCFLAWTFGFTLCAAEQVIMLNELPEVINILLVDLLDLTPSVAASIRRSEVPSVKWLYCIGEALSSTIVQEWSELCVNSYGPTEAAFCTTIYPVTKDMVPAVIGKPFPSTTFAIFSPQGNRPLPILSVGELHIGGAQLARGYFGKPILTDQQFVSKCGQRFYKSGDMVRMLSNRDFEFVGRRDDQVKIRGLRVELGEISVVLQASDSRVITALAQILKKDATSKDQLVAFVVTNSQIEKSELDAVRHNLERKALAHLPPYMVPRFILFVDRIPRSMAGKVDKTALTKIFQESAETNPLPNGAEHAPKHNWTELEKCVRDILSRLSKTALDEISETTSIFQLGLDSISAVQIAGALRRHGYNVGAADVLRYVSCKDLAAYIDAKASPEVLKSVCLDFKAFEQKHRAAVLEKANVEEGHVRDIRPCTPLQTGMISQFLATEGAVYLNHLRLELQSNVDIEKLKEAWITAMECHIILRTGFVHVKDIDHPYAMIEYSSSAVDLPWTAVMRDNVSSHTTDEWLRNLQLVFLEKLSSPPWALQIVHSVSNTYLDIGMFHGIFDAQSLKLLLDDVASIYQGQILPEPVPLNPVIDGILSLSSQDIDNGNSFWSHLGKTTVPCRFPNLAPLRYHPVPPVLHSKQSVRSMPDLEAGCRAANITLQVAGIASWLALLSAYTGESPVTCGVVLSGRNFEATENAVFPCINTVPFACPMPQDRRDMLDAVMILNAEVQRYQYTPLSVIQKLMGYPNEALFDTLFAFQKFSNSNNEHNLWSIVDENAKVEYPMSIELEPKHGHLQYRLTFMPHIVPQEQAFLILDQLDSLLESLIFSETALHFEKSFNPDLYSIAPPDEPVLQSEARLLHEFVEITAIRNPQRIALEFAYAISNNSYSSQKWTFSELDTEGNRIAHLLIRHGVQPGELVGICFEKCPEASFAILGILKAGCAFVAIDPGAPATRQAFIVKDSQARLVLSMASLFTLFEHQIEVPMLNLDEERDVDLPKSKPVLIREIDIQDRSYCLYTSGTTGTPKGCELTHENAVQALLAFQRLFANHWDADSRWLQFASFHFDVSVLEQYWSWSVGICVVSAPRDLIFEDLANSINILGITHIDLTPSLAQILRPEEVPSLCKGVFITGGESLKQEILDVWGPKGVIYNGYGPTEATIGVTMYPRVPANGKPSNIGRQFDNVGSYVLQPGSDIPVLRGGVGELCISGKLVGKGYLNRPELTAERFPHLECFGERVYRTGDVVRMLHNRTFDFLGRTDDQIKLRGQRLEVGEINSVIKQSGSGILDVASLVLKHLHQQKEQLVAFITTERGSNSEPKVLSDNTRAISRAREACHKKLPPYMVPTHLIHLTRIPLNVNNKADVRTLRDIYDGLSASELQTLSAASKFRDGEWTAQETKLRDVLVAELDVSGRSINKHTSFFELGMDSISVIHVSRAMKQAGFANASASVVLRYSNVAHLVQHLEANGSSKQDSGLVLAAQQSIIAIEHRHRWTVVQLLATDPSAIEAIAPCTPLQQGMIASYLESDRGLYFNSFHFELNNNVDEEKLQTAWKSVYEANQILRTVFVDTEDGYVQVVLRGVPLRWLTETVTNGESVVDRLARLQQKRSHINRTELKEPFKVLLVTTPTQKHLVVHIFHGLYDGNSIRLIFNAVWDVYNGREQNQRGPSFHSALAHGPLRAMPGAKNFWQEHLSSSALIPFPGLVNEPSDSPVIVTRVLYGLEGFNATRRKLNVTAQAIAQGCWLNSLQVYSGTTTTTGIVVSGRSIDLDGAASIVGPMFNTIPYMHRSQHGDTWASVIKRVHEFNTTAHPYQHTPLREIMKWCKKSPSQPLFDTLFVYQVAEGDDKWATNDAWQISEGGAVTDHAVAIEIEQIGHDRFSLTLVTQGHISNTRASNKLLDRFEAALKQVLKDPLTVLDVPATVNRASSDTVPESSMQIDSDMAGNFEWTSSASKIREEIARLCEFSANEISETTSIFELGLDSIDAIKLSSKLKRRDVNLPLSTIMRGLTIAKMLPSISSVVAYEDRIVEANLELQKRNLWSHLQKRSFNMDGIENTLPLTPLQEAMVAEMISSQYARYYNNDVLKLDPDTDVQALCDAWIRVVEASPILRTSFVEVDDPDLDDTFVQVVHRKHHDFWSRCELQEQSDFGMLVEENRAGMIQAKGLQPPFNVLLVETPSQSYLLLSISHALYDGWSLSLLHNDIQDAYYGCFVPRPNYELPLADILSTSGPEAASFWEDLLVGAQPSSFVRRIRKVEDQSVHRHQHESRVSIAKMTSFAKQRNISVQTLGQTTFAMVLACYTSSLDVTFGSVLSGRDDDLRARVLFPTMNTMAIRTILHGTHLEMLHYVQDNFSNIKQWQHFPLRKALALAGGSGKLFDSLFIYQKSPEKKQNANRRLYTSVQGQSEVEYPVCVEMEVVDGEIIWRCAISDEILSEAGSKEFLDRMEEVMTRVVEYPEVQVIEVTPKGISVGGLPVFKEKVDQGHNLGEKPMDAQHETHQPESETAQKVRNILSTVSKIPEDDITRSMTIFHIGLDSISVIKVASLLRKQGIFLSVSEILRAGTIEKLAVVAEARLTPTVDHRNSEPAIVEALEGIDLDSIREQAEVGQDNVEEILPITAGQLYMLSMWISSAGRNFYPEFDYQIHEAVTLETIQHSWQALIQANPVLRTVFVPTGSNRMPYVQLVLQKIQHSITDVTTYEGDEAREYHQETAFRQPWVHLFVSKESSCWNLRVHIHHALYDGVSLPLLMQQFQQLCNGLAAPSPEKTFASLLAAGHSASARKDRKSFWTNYLKDVAQQQLRHKALPKFRVEIFRPFLLPTSAIEATARRHGVSTQSLVLAAYAKIYAMTIPTPRDQDVIIGVYLANRWLPIEGLEQVAIPTVNLLPLRVASPAKHSHPDLAAKIQEDLHDISSLASASASLFEISEWTGVKVDTFVNILTLPDTGEIEDTARDRSDIKIKPVEQWQAPVSRISEGEEVDSAMFSTFANERVNGAYLHAIDVEVTMRNGSLNVGVFAPSGLLDLEAGENLIEIFKTELMNME